jgi:predicted nucleic acid-binding protein
MTVEEAIADVTRLAFDTSPLIYFIEANPRYDRIMSTVFGRIDGGILTGVTSLVSLTEVLVRPISLGRDDLQRQYSELLLSSSGFHSLPVDAPIAIRAAELRAQYRLRTPDALQAATAIEAGCQAILCNDLAMRRITEIRVIVLDELTSN